METVEVLVGTIGRAHGTRGDVVVNVRTDEPERRFARGTGFTTERGRLVVNTTSWHSGRLLVTFAGVQDRTAAEALSGTQLRVVIGADERPDDPDEFYDHQLVGLRAETVNGADVGEVVDVLHLPSQDVLTVRRPDGDEVLVPFVAALVPTVDLAARVVRVVDQPGLITDDPADDAASGGRVDG